MHDRALCDRAMRGLKVGGDAVRVAVYAAAGARVADWSRMTTTPGPLTPYDMTAGFDNTHRRCELGVMSRKGGS